MTLTERPWCSLDREEIACSSESSCVVLLYSPQRLTTLQVGFVFLADSVQAVFTMIYMYQTLISRFGTQSLDSLHPPPFFTVFLTLVTFQAKRKR